MEPGKPFLRWLPALLLGLATIGSYGVVSYGIGVLLPAIADDTGWSPASVAGGVSLGLLGQGVVALLAGRLLDTRGSGAVLVPSLAAGGLALAGAAAAAEAWQFVLLWASGSAIVGGSLFYNVTMPMVTRLYPDNRPAALSALTLLGALASPVFFPIAGLFVEEWGWRQALLGLTVLAIVCATPAAVLVRVPAGPPRDRAGGGAGLWSSLRSAAVYRLVLVAGLIGFGHTALMLYQVPALQAAGLSLGAASAFAGARGFFQIPGRLLLTPLTVRFGVRGATYICYGGALTSVLALYAALDATAATVLIVYFSAAGGMAMGLRSPLAGLLQADVFGNTRLGFLTGVATLAGSLASALGALLAGLLLDFSASYGAVLLLAAGAHLLAIAAFAWQGRTQEADIRDVAPPLP